MKRESPIDLNFSDKISFARIAPCYIVTHGIILQAEEEIPKSHFLFAAMFQTFKIDFLF